MAGEQQSSKARRERERIEAYEDGRTGKGTVDPVKCSLTMMEEVEREISFNRIAYCVLDFESSMDIILLARNDSLE